MSYVSRFVRVDARVFDEDLAPWFPEPVARVRGQLGGENLPIEAGIDVAGAGYFERSEALDRSHPLDHFLSDLARRLAQRLRKLKRQGQSVLAELHPGWLLDDYLRQFKPIALAQEGADAFL
jgi:hypothetical protein